MLKASDRGVVYLYPKFSFLVLALVFIKVILFCEDYLDGQNV